LIAELAIGAGRTHRAATVLIGLAAVLLGVCAAASTGAVAYVGAAFRIRILAIRNHLAAAFVAAQIAGLTAIRANSVTAKRIDAVAAAALKRLRAACTVSELSEAMFRGADITIVAALAVRGRSAFGAGSGFTIAALTISEEAAALAIRARRAAVSAAIDIALATVFDLVVATDRDAGAVVTELFGSAMLFGQALHAVALPVTDFAVTFAATAARIAVLGAAAVVVAAAFLAVGILSRTGFRRRTFDFATS